MEQPRKCFDHFDEANLDEEAKVRTLKIEVKTLDIFSIACANITPNVVPSG